MGRTSRWLDWEMSRNRRWVEAGDGFEQTLVRPEDRSEQR